MKLEHYPVEKLKEDILKILNKYLDLSQYKVFFFGSKVKGNADERADIDIGIEGQEIPLYIKLEIEEELENLPILYKIDYNELPKILEYLKILSKN